MADRNLGNRILPAPTGAIDVLRNANMSGPVPDVEAVRQLVPKNEAEWLAVSDCHRPDTKGDSQ